MAGGRSYTASILVLSLVLLIAFADVAQGYNKLRPQDCKGKCTYRCSATSHKKPCMFFCQKCCAKCLCVPAGVYGNKQTCACYNNWKTQEGKPKCP
ncbi:protein RSI-1-like [Cynara cardunculus var. scolymus]|uniref:protein RSI-1-like n=1 Tax=Cynara cardunculus var. scolymus TaxID=59895 RepID=UPI000D62D857|nr:protein RSI-1-like [Cynara cardunculus var. scolymus]